MNFFLVGPDVFQVNGVAVLVIAKRVFEQIDVEITGKCVCNDERRRCEEIHTHERVNATFKVAVAGQDAGADDVAACHCIGNFRKQWSRVADAGRAAVTHRVETYGIQVVQQICFFEIVGNNPGAWRQARLDPWFRLETFGVRVTRQQSGSDHNHRVRGIGATCNGCDKNRAIANLDVLAVNFCDSFATVSAVGNGGFEVIFEHAVSRLQEDAVLWTFRSGNAGLNGTEIQFERVGVQRICLSVFTPEPLFAGIGLDHFDMSFIATRKLKVAYGLIIDRENRAGGAELR